MDGEGQRSRRKGTKSSSVAATNTKTVLILVLALAACVSSILSGMLYARQHENNKTALTAIEEVAARMEEIRLQARDFIRSGDAASWERIERFTRSSQSRLQELLAVTGRRRAEVESFLERLSAYSGMVSRLHDPVVELSASKGKLRQGSLEFATEIERSVIVPFREDEGLRLYSGEPADPFKARVKDEAQSLLSLYLKQQVLLLELVLYSDLASYKAQRDLIAADISRHESQLRYIGVLLGGEPEVERVLASLQGRIAALLTEEQSITAHYASILAIEGELRSAEEALIEHAEALRATMTADIELDNNRNLVRSLAIFGGTLGALALFGALLARDVMRFVRNLETAHVALKESEARFRTVMEQAADGMFLCELSGAIIDVNQRVCDHLGYTREELCSMNLADLSVPAGAPLHARWAELQPGRSLTVECTDRRKDGGTFPAEFRFGLIVSAGRTAVLGIARDITERKRAQEALRLSEENLRITLDSIGDGVIATDTDGRVTGMNRVAEQLCGRRLGESRGRPLGEVFRIVDADTRQPLSDPVAAVLRDNTIVETPRNAALLSADGREYRIADSAAPIRGEEGKVSGAVFVFRDVTEKRRLEERLRQSEKMDAIGQLAGGIAHDFNNMLMGISGATELMAPFAESNPEVAESVEPIVETVGRASDLTRKLLSFSRKGKMISSTFDVHTCVDNALALLERSIDRRIVIRRSFAATPSAVKGDSTQLQNAFLNLGINARDAMPEGGTLSLYTRNIELDQESCRQSNSGLPPGHYIEVTVQDSGVGMSKSTLSRVFEPFFTTKGRDKGTGLGLASVYGAVKEHGGDVHVYSELGRGTAFKICLPAASDDVPEERPDTVMRPLKPASILIVDDEEVIRSTLASYLSARGCTVLLAEDGEHATEVFRREAERIDLVILDLVMPRKNGRETFQALKAIDPGVRVIVSSGFPFDTSAQEIMESGARGFVQKPYRMRELVAVIDRALG